MDDAIGHPGERFRVRDDHHGALRGDRLQQLIDELARLRVQVPCGLVGKNQRWAIGQGPSDRHALLFAARQFPRPMVETLAEPDAFEQRPGPWPALPGRHAVELHGQGHVFERGEVGDQVETLEDEADRLSTEARERLFRECRQGLTGHHDVA